MIEIVPVGATVVTLQFRSRRIGRIRSPSASRAQVSSGPQMLRSHSGNMPRIAGQPLRLGLGLLVHELLHLPAQRHALLGVVGDAELDEDVGQAHDAEPDPADPLGQVGDLGSGYWLASMTFSRKWVERCTSRGGGPNRSRPSLRRTRRG